MDPRTLGILVSRELGGTRSRGLDKMGVGLVHADPDTQRRVMEDPAGFIGNTNARARQAGIDSRLRQQERAKSVARTPFPFRGPRRRLGNLMSMGDDVTREEVQEIQDRERSVPNVQTAGGRSWNPLTNYFQRQNERNAQQRALEGQGAYAGLTPRSADALRNWKQQNP